MCTIKVVHYNRIYLHSLGEMRFLTLFAFGEFPNTFHRFISSHLISSQLNSSQRTLTQRTNSLHPILSTPVLAPLLSSALLTGNRAFKHTTSAPLHMSEAKDQTLGRTLSSPKASVENLRPSASGLALISVMTSIGAGALQAFAADTAAPVAEEKVVLGPAPTDFGLKYDYYTDAQIVVNHMRYATQMEKGDPKLVDVATKTKAEMNEFVSYYRRFNGINGKQSFSLLYTSVNVLAGHYTSYGVKFPVPEKRRKRLLQVAALFVVLSN
jgi:photosystem II protein Psb27